MLAFSMNGSNGTNLANVMIIKIRKHCVKTKKRGNEEGSVYSLQEYRKMLGHGKNDEMMVLYHWSAHYRLWLHQYTHCPSYVDTAILSVQDRNDRCGASQTSGRA
jgi:hypothetical protein